MILLMHYSAASYGVSVKKKKKNQSKLRGIKPFIKNKNALSDL
jgi:hypothetical protein